VIGGPAEAGNGGVPGAGNGADSSSRKRKVGKEDIVRIQKDDEMGLSDGGGSSSARSPAAPAGSRE